MNKKFSTLVAVILAAGAWTTLDAKMTLTSATDLAAGNGGEYVVGVDADDPTTYDVLLNTTNGQGEANVSIGETTGKWTLAKSGSNFTLKAGGKCFTASNAENASASTLTFGTAENDNVELQFSIENDGKLKLANVTDFTNNSAISGKTLYLKLEASSIASLVEDAAQASAFVFGTWSADNTEDPGTGGEETNAPYPGYDDLSVDEDGVVEVGEDATIDAPLYVSVGEGDKAVYLSVNAKGEVFETEKPVIGANGAWGVDEGKYYSIALKRAEVAKCYLSVKKATKAASETYELVAKADVVADGLTTAKATVNTTVPAADVVATATILDQGVKRVSAVNNEYVFVALNVDGSGITTVLGKGGAGAALNTITESNLTDYLWKVKETKNSKGVYYYTFTNMDGKTVWTVDGNNTEFYATGKYAADADLYLTNNGKVIGANFAAAEPAVAISLYTSPLVGRTNTFLNDLLNNGFNLTIKINKDSKKEVEYLDAFAGKLTAQGDKDDKQFQIKSEDGKFLVLNTKKLTNITGVNGVFELVDEDKISADHLSYFQLNYLFGGTSDELIAELLVAKTAAMEDATKAYIVETPDGNYLTTKVSLSGSEKRPYITLGADNIVPVKDLVGKFWRISFADKRTNTVAADKYKVGGVLATKRNEANTAADYIPASEVYAYAPEAQWGVVDADLATNKVKLQNRESGEELQNVLFRNNGDGTYTMIWGTESDLVKLEAADKVTMFDGYKAYTENEVRNNNFYLGQYHAVDGNNHAYFVENHKNSHQIGMTAEEGKADKWNLRFATRDVKVDGKKQAVVDTLFITTPLLKLKADGSKDDKTNDVRLAILPYAFQKVDNREFVDYKSGAGYNYYICDETNKENANEAKRFALKLKADGEVYNFVEITNGNEGDKLYSDDKDQLGAVKVKVANSENKGALRQMSIYAEDENSLMVVEKAESPEYHLVNGDVLAWGDTVILARSENPSQVLYEKFDAKSVVAKDDTMSFLNIDNIKQFNINPALFVDTAYVNRGTEEDPNTCYQYLLAVRQSYGRHIDGCGVPGHEQTVGAIDTVYGDFLVNLVDTANLYDDIHNNWYVNENEAGEEKLAKLAFVTGFHTNDTLYIVKAENDTVKIGMDTPDFNVAKFAFRYTNADKQTFKIQTQYKEFLGGGLTKEEAEEEYEGGKTISNEGYLKWINGTVVVTEGFENGDEFVIEEGVDRAPTANETITTSEVKVIAGEGQVTIAGAAGKKVVISNILGQVVANTVLASDNAVIAAPQGVVVVAVEGEAAVKAIVK